MVSSEMWTAQMAADYDADCAEMFADDVLVPTVDLLADLARSGPALEFAVGTGRVAIPLSARGVPVSGIEYSEPMVQRLCAKTAAVPVTVGDMATTRVAGEFALVYLVFNTLGNLLTQDEQVECFRNAARHLATGGRFVIEIGVPSLRLLPPTAVAVPFDVSEEHLGFDTFDVASQLLTSHHYRHRPDGTVQHESGTFRYVWPAECDLMARLAGLELEARYADWDRSAFTSESTKHVSIWRKP